jgi:two-component system, OmpR family, sensor histidine kinase BaeS
MIRKNIAAKIGLVIMGLILAVSIVQYFALGQLLRNAFYQEAGTELLTEGQQFANMSSMGGTMMMHMLCVTADASLVMVNTDESVISASPSIHLSKPNVEDSSLIHAALSGKSAIHAGYSQLFGNSGLVAAVPIGQVSGAVLLFRPESVVERAFHHVKWLLVIAGLGGMLVALGMTVILSKRLASPLQQMANVAREMNEGNYTAKVPVTGDDEVGKLGVAINELAANLHHLDTSRKEFLADVAHELRTPMSYIRGYSQVLVEGLVESPEESKNYIQIIHDESIRLETLINDLFVLAQADAQMLQIEKQPMQFADVIDSVTQRMQKKAEDKGVTFRTQVSPLPIIEADPERLLQVLVNLVDNAIRYTPSGGSIEISQKRLGDWVEVSVSDTGVGIPRDDLSYIWDRLYRVEKSRSRAGGGTGLGLAIVKQIVEAHGGTVHAESVENFGTTISFRIPC